MTLPKWDRFRAVRGRARQRGLTSRVVLRAVLVAVLAAVPVVVFAASSSHARTGGLGPGRSVSTATPLSPTLCLRSTPCGAASEGARDVGAMNGNYTLSHALAWSQVTPPPAGFGSGGGMVANSSSGVAVVFGGVSPGGNLTNSTFAYSEASDRWSAVAASVAPSPRSDFAFAFDAASGKAILFGGLTDLATLSVSNETWAYDVAAAQWSRWTGGPVPPAREAAAFAIVPSLGVGVLYGGWNRNYSMTGSLTYSDLWELNLSTGAWSNVSVTGARPPPLEGASMTWDPSTSSLDLFGGCYPCSSAVWQLDPVSLRWTELSTPLSAPAPRAATSWAYDPILGADLLFGGTNGVTAFNDTEVFSSVNDTWISQTFVPAPLARSNAASAFLDVPDNETWLVAGGQSGATIYSDLWRLSATANLSLRVVNASSPLSPLEGALVSLGGHRIGSTDSSGYLNLTQVNVVGSALNVTDDPWYSPVNGTLWLAPGRPTNRTVGLVPEIRGTVHVTVDSPVGFLKGALIDLYVDGVLITPAPVASNATGNATFYGVPPGSVNATCSAVDWRPAYEVGVLPPGGVLNLTIEMYPDPVLTVSVFGSLPGGAVLPLVSAGVLVNRTYFGSTNSTGIVSGVTSTLGLVPVTAKATGFVGQTTYLEIPFTGPVNTSLVLASVPFGTLPVTVERTHDNFPISGASVYANTTVSLAFGPYAASNSTDIAGTTSLSLPEGTYFVTAMAAGYIASAGTLVSVASGPNPPVTFHLSPVPPANVRLIVRDRATGGPVPGANVTIMPGPIYGRASAWGYYNATNLSPGAYTFMVSAPGYLTNVTVLTLFSFENRTLIVNLTALIYTSSSGSGWGFNLFPGSWDELWPFLLVPLFLVVGGFVFASALRGLREREEEEPESASRTAPTASPPTFGKSETGSDAAPRPLAPSVRR